MAAAEWHRLMPKRRERILDTLTDFGNRTIAVLATCWNDHVLRNHPDMALRMDDVRAAIATPDVVLENHAKNFKNWLYYKEFDSAQGKKYLKVCVRWDTQFGTDGFLTTTFDDTRVGGGKQVWP